MQQCSCVMPSVQCLTGPPAACKPARSSAAEVFGVKVQHSVILQQQQPVSRTLIGPHAWPFHCARRSEVKPLRLDCLATMHQSARPGPRACSPHLLSK